MTTDPGFFVLADLSGFTAYLAEVELEHAHAIVRELLELLVGQLTPPLRLAALEGDGVLAYAPVEHLARGELLLELVEATYAAFRERTASMARRTTCTCRACRALPQLDLKFLVHAGEYELQQVPGAPSHPELLGLDVDLVRRRLLKPPVSAATGWRGYALFTDAALARMGVAPQALDAHRQEVAAGPAGQVVTYTLDLDRRFQEMLAARRAFVSAAQADAVVTQELAAEPHVVWAWLNEPRLRTRWMRGRAWSEGERPGGRTGVGARNHCEHGLGTATETILDWRPFEYFTLEVRPEPGSVTLLQTYRLQPLAGGRGTRLHTTVFFKRPLPRWLARPVCRLAFGPLLRGDLARLARLLATEQA